MVAEAPIAGIISQGTTPHLSPDTKVHVPFSSIPPLPYMGISAASNHLLPPPSRLSELAEAEAEANPPSWAVTRSKAADAARAIDASHCRARAHSYNCSLLLTASVSVSSSAPAPLWPCLRVASIAPEARVSAGAPGDRIPWIACRGIPRSSSLAANAEHAAAHPSAASAGPSHGETALPITRRLPRLVLILLAGALQCGTYTRESSRTSPLPD